MADNEALMARFHRAVVDALRETREQPFAQPVTVAEIYKDLVPYARARALLGIDLNADYEHALVRFLSGEGGRARLEPENARRELREELALKNPNVTIYRKFAACDVFISELPGPPASAPSASAASASSAPESVLPVTSDISAREVRLDDESGRRSPAVPGAPEQERAPEAAAASRAPGAWCHACGSELPRGHEARFCPYCGSDLLRRPCGSCGATLEPGWSYCIKCGEAARPA
ncbi:MAG: zinc ribbon domain-containing protein [Longimicrobiales bacterium]